MVSCTGPVRSSMCAAREGEEANNVDGQIVAVLTRLLSSVVSFQQY